MDVNQDQIWDHYQNDAPDSFSGSDARINYLINQIPKGAVCLNIGVGAGNLEKFAKQKSIDVHSLDPSIRSIENLKSLIGENAKVGYSQAIPFDNESFDVVIMTEVLEHLESDVLTKTYSEVCRVLKSNGKFIGTVPSNEDLSANVVVSPSDGYIFHRWGHLQSFSINRLEKDLGSDFKKVRVKELVFVNWKTLNWKGKIISGLKLFTHKMGSSGTGRNLYFEAKR